MVPAQISIGMWEELKKRQEAYQANSMSAATRPDEHFAEEKNFLLRDLIRLTDGAMWEAPLEQTKDFHGSSIALESYEIKCAPPQ